MYEKIVHVLCIVYVKIYIYVNMLAELIFETSLCMYVYVYVCV